MALEEKRILVGLLEKGMFVSRLDRDWVGTPFPFQGFYIQSDEDLDLLGNYCTSVFVDALKGLDPDERLLKLSRSSRSVFPPRTTEYSNSVGLLEELPEARNAQAILHQMACRIEADMRAGKRLSPSEVRDAVEPMVQSLIRNSDAMFWVLSLMRRNDYSYSHAVNCSALAAAFGRHLALPREVLVELATGGFLLDLGMATLPEPVLGQAEVLTPEEISMLRGHVREGVRVFDESGIRGPWARDMLAHHHERHDGSGYPAGLSGDAIPLAGRMAAIIDTYDAVVSDRPHCKGDSRHGALQTLYRGADRLYQGEVVEQFLQCLCVYPTGSLVELSTGEVAVVMAQNPARRLRPRVMLLLDAEKQPYSPYRDIDLMSLPSSEAGLPPPTRIVAALEPGSYGLDPAELYL